jgi:hypothetical protein
MSERLKQVRDKGNVFVDLGFHKLEAENLKMRSDLMIRIVQFQEARHDKGSRGEGAWPHAAASERAAEGEKSVSSAWMAW